MKDRSGGKKETSPQHRRITSENKAMSGPRTDRRQAKGSLRAASVEWMKGGHETFLRNEKKRNTIRRHISRDEGGGERREQKKTLARSKGRNYVNGQEKV